MLERVRRIWITGVLEQSLHGAVLIELGLRDDPEVLDNPWRLAVQEVDRPARPLPAGTHITQVYDEAEGALLLLGEPGAGKTTLLLELARELLRRADEQQHQPMPVVFTLSTWAKQRQPLAEWLVEELQTKYEVPHKLGQMWVSNEQLLLLLDGLDEVAPAARQDCITAINQYRQQHPLVPLVVCSRTADYLSKSTHLRLHSAVIIQPLTQEQIDTYLAQRGAQGAVVREALRQDIDLQELATTPLMLPILMLVSLDTSLDEITMLSSSQRKQGQLFASYVQHMLKRRRAEPRYTQEQTTHWLACLAQEMSQQNQTVFYLEQMQLTWLPEGRWRRAYERLAVRLPGIVIGVLLSLIVSIVFFPDLNVVQISIIYGLIGGLVGGVFSGSNTDQPSAEITVRTEKPSGRRLINAKHVRNGLLFGLSAGLNAGQIGGLSFGLSTGLSFGLSTGLSSVLLSVIFEKGNTARLGSEMVSPSNRSLWHSLINARHLRNGLLVGLLFGLSFILSNWLSNGGLSFGPSDGLVSAGYYVQIVGLSTGLVGGVSLGLIGTLLSVILVGRNRTIQPAEIIVWSWRSLIKARHLRNGLLVGLLFGLSFILSVGLSFGLFFGLSYDGLIFGLREALSFGVSDGLSVGLIYWLLAGLFTGLSSERLKEHRRVVPNQGMRSSARNGLLVGFISGLIILRFVLFVGPIGALIGALAGGLLAGLLNGGLACIQHGVLRWLLQRKGSIPRNYPHFLDYAAERVLLRKVGGGYIFVHRLLLDYFAALESSDRAAQPSSAPPP